MTNNTTPHWRTVAEGIAGALIIAGTIMLSPFLRRRIIQWGASNAEADRSFPGDEIVPQPRSQMTLALTVQAPAARIWPWFIQLGCQRAGWYSYDLLDNGGRPSARIILPDFQKLQVGDVVKAMPQGDFGFPVAAIEPEHRLTLGGTLRPDPKHPEAYFSGDQTFLLEPLDHRTTRLFFRMRLDWNRSLFNQFAYGAILTPISFVMARKTLLNVKQRAEEMA